MRQIHIQSLNVLTEMPLIARLEQFNDTPAGVAAFLDELETREIKIPMLSRIPDLAEYGRPLTRYLLFLHEIDTSMILVPHVHDELIGERVWVEVRFNYELYVSLYKPNGREVFNFGLDTTHLGTEPDYLYDYTVRSIHRLLGYTPSPAGKISAYNYAAMQSLANGRK